MSTTIQLDDLLRRWEEGQRSRPPVTPEDLCRNCPEMLELLRRAITDRQQVERVMDTIAPAGDARTATREPAPLPEVELRPGAEPVPGFRLIRLLGAGGFGAVWQAEAPGGFAVALKFVSLLGEVGAVEVQSLEILRRLRHPNVLTTFGSWRSATYLIVAMELADRTLADRLRQAQQQRLPGIPTPELLEYMRGAARGIDYLNQPHATAEGQPSLPVQHRDIKPQNLLLVGDAVKVADFGLARVLQRTVVSHQGNLTPVFAAPEFFCGQTSRHSDQYSLAASYCMLRGGRPPFAGEMAELMLGHVQGKPDLSMVPEGEQPAVARALAKRPEERWPSCTAFVAALSAAQTAPPLSPVRSDRPTTRPAYRWLPVATAVLLLIAAGAGIFLANENTIRQWWSKSSVNPNTSPSVHVPPATPTEQMANAKAVVSPTPPSAPNNPTSANPTSPAGPANVSTKPKEPLSDPKEPPVGERLSFKHTRPIRCLAWVPGTDQVLTGDDAGKLWLWGTSKRGDVRSFVGHEQAVQCVTVSADGRYALSGGDDRTVRLWEIDSGQARHVLRKKTVKAGDEEFEVYGVAFDRGHRRALSAGNANLLIGWDLDAGAENRRLEVPMAETYSLAVSADGRYAVLGGQKGGLKLLDLAADGKAAARDGHADDILAVAFFPDSQRFVSAGGGLGPEKGREDYVVRVWKVAEPGPVHLLKGHAARVTSVAVSPNGQRVLTGDAAGTLRLWDADSGNELPQFDRTKDDGPTRAGVASVAFSPDGAEAVSGHTDGGFRVWILPKARR